MKLMNFPKGSKAAELIAKVEYDDLCEICDSSCTTGYDNNGSIGFEIFENGFNFAIAANGNQIYFHEDENTAFFFIGPLDKIEEKLSDHIMVTEASSDE